MIVVAMQLIAVEEKVASRSLAKKETAGLRFIIVHALMNRPRNVLNVAPALSTVLWQINERPGISVRLPQVWELGFFVA